MHYVKILAEVVNIHPKCATECIRVLVVVLCFVLVFFYPISSLTVCLNLRNSISNCRPKPTTYHRSTTGLWSRSNLRICLLLILVAGCFILSSFKLFFLVFPLSDALQPAHLPFIQFIIIR